MMIEPPQFAILGVIGGAEYLIVGEDAGYLQVAIHHVQGDVRVGSEVPYRIIEVDEEILVTLHAAQ
jgi:hypothetical protein